MKTKVLVLVAGIAVAATSCKRDPGHGFPIPEARAAECNSPVAPAIPPGIENRVREKGQAIAAQAFGVLSSRLGQAIADAGYTLAQIKKAYPADEATGFKLGQLRGLWSVDFKRSDFIPSR